MKHVIMIIHPSTAIFARVMIRDIASAFKRIHEHVHLFEITDPEGEIDPAIEYFSGLADTPEDLILIDLNANFNLKLHKEGYVGQRFSFLIDHPYHHFHKMESYPGSHICSVVDKTHLNAFSYMNVGIDASFVPHGGPIPDPDRPRLKDRPIDVLFCGNISPLVFTHEIENRLAGLPPLIRPVVNRAIEAVLLEHASPDDAIIRAFGVTPGPGCLEAIPHKILSNVINTVEGYISARKRYEVLHQLVHQDHLKVHLIGNKLEMIFRLDPDFKDRDNVVFYDYMDFDQVLGMMGQAKISLNCAFALAGGSHERLWQGMALGCATLTNQSIYMHENFDPNSDIIMLPHDVQGVVDLVDSRLSNLSRLQDETDGCLAKYTAGHTWAHRVQDMAASLNLSG